MFGIGLGELMLILIVALIFISPEKLPEVAKSLAKTYRDLLRAGNDLKRTVTEADILDTDIPAADKKAQAPGGAGQGGPAPERPDGGKQGASASGPEDNDGKKAT